MTVAAVTRRVQYTVGGSGQAGPYAFTFTVLDEGDLAVYQGSTTSSTLKTLTTHYTVALSADGTGSITFVGGQEPTTAQLITIIGDRAISRTTDFTAGGDIRASTMNSDLDALTVQQQQLDEAMDRAVQVEIFGNRDWSSLGPLFLPYDTPANNKNKILAYDATGAALTTSVSIGEHRGNWAADTAYVIRDVVRDSGNGNVYFVNEAHTSSGSLPISGNTDAAKFTIIVDGASATTSATAAATSAQLADDWAVKTSGVVADSEYSSKAYAVGGTGVTSSSGKGAAKEWATTTGAAVDTSEYSAKEYALGTTVAAGSAKDWAILAEDSLVDGGSGYSSLHHAAKGAASATAAASSASSASSSASSASSSASTASTQASNSSTSAASSASSATSAAASAASSSAAGLTYAYSTTTTDSDPGSGIIRFNHATLSSATAAYVDDNDANSVDVSTHLLTWDDSSTTSNRGTLKMVKSGTPSTYALYTISGASTDASGYVKLALTHVASNGSFSDTDTVIIHNTRTGDTGSFSSGAVDLNGEKLTLDANANTSIHADTDDQIDIEIAGADDFRFTANSFNALSGSTINIDSGASIVNSGTATGFGMDSESAYAGVLEANATFVDQAIFGPSVDGKSWNGKWSVASLYSSLMLVTIEDAGADTQVNIWDLTEVSSSAPSTTPLGTVTLSGAATPTSVAACQGYICVGSEDGISIIDPFSGSWAERTVGWPRSLSTSTTPALGSNDVEKVAAGLSNQPPFDPRTGGSMPSFMANLGATDYISFLFPDGTVGNYGSPNAVNGSAIAQGCAYWADTVNTLFQSKSSGIAAGNVNTGTYILKDNSYPYGFMPDNALSFGSHGNAAVASASGLSLINAPVAGPGLGTLSTGNAITRAYNTGYLVGDIRGAWLANSATTDRSYKGNTLTANGSITEAAVETSAELMGYSGWSASNDLTRASDADWDVITTGSAYMSIWVKDSGTSGYVDLFNFCNSGSTIQFAIQLHTTGGVARMVDDGATAAVYVSSGPNCKDGAWHKIDAVRVSSTERYLYVDGVEVASSTTDAGSLSDSGNLPLRIGVNQDGSSNPATNSTLALARLSTTAPSATQIRQMYDAEKPMFVASAECLLQSSSTDAVLDVDCDPLTGKVLVTQTDAITVFSGLAVDSKPTVNSGNSEKGKLWGALRAEQNSANAYVTAPAVDQRQVNEMVRGLASDLPAGVDLSKAAAWVYFDASSGLVINASYNIKSVTDNGVGSWDVNYGIPFKTANYIAIGLAKAWSDYDEGLFISSFDTDSARLFNVNGSNTMKDSAFVCFAFFGELENE